MKHDEFVGEIQHRTHLPSRGAAEAAIRATLETLADRIPEATARHLGDQLPHELGHFLRSGRPSRISLGEFYEHVAAREETDVATAAFHARVVITMMAETVSSGIMSKVRRELPKDYEPLLLPERGAAAIHVMA
jgi:uncharacterized protein (DUF2267 family)